MTTIHPAHLLPNAHRPSNRLLQRLEILRIHHRKESSPLSAKSSITPEDHISLTSTASPAKHVIKKRAAPEQQPASHKPTAGEIAKDVGISMIPVVGTVYEFKKGNIGWGIFSFFTDLLCLIPVVGPLARVVSGAIRGGAVAARAIRAGAVAAEAGTKIATAAAEAGAKAVTTAAAEAGAKAATTAATEAGAKAAASTSEAAAKALTTTAASEVTEELAKASAELTKAVLRAVDPGIELLYKSGKGLGKFFSKNSEKIATGFIEKISKGKLLPLQAKKWKFLNTTDVKGIALSKVEHFKTKYATTRIQAINKRAKSGIKLTEKGLMQEMNLQKSGTFNKALENAEFIINGKAIKRGTTEEMLKSFEKAIPGDRQSQIVSIFADDEIFRNFKFNPPESKTIEKLLKSKKMPLIYKIKTLPGDRITLTAIKRVNRKDFSETSKMLLSSIGSKFKKMKIRADMVLEPMTHVRDYKDPTIIYSYRLNKKPLIR